MGKPVILCGQHQTSLVDIDLCFILHLRCFHLCLETGADTECDDQGNQDADDYFCKTRLAVAFCKTRAAYIKRFSLISQLQILFTAVQILGKTSVPIVIPEFIQEAFCHFFLAVIGKDDISITMCRDVVIPIFGGKQQDDTALVLAISHFVLIPQMLIGFPYFHSMQAIQRDDINAALIFLCQFPCPCTKFCFLVICQKICAVRYHHFKRDRIFIEGRIIHRGKSRTNHHYQQTYRRAESEDLLFHLFNLPYYKNQNPSWMSSIRAAIPANQAKYFPLSIGRSPTSFPV